MMDPNAALLSASYVDPLVRLKYFGAADASSLSFVDLLLGAQIGALGASQIGALLLGGLFILARRARQWEIPASFLAGVIVLAGIFWAVDPQHQAGPVFHLLTGSTVLCAFFLATDPSCSPRRFWPMLLYGFMGGCLVVVIRVYGIYIDGAPFAVLIINLLTPQLAGIRPKPFGVN
jgi:electron transport complex protein RnfD